MMNEPSQYKKIGVVSFCHRSVQISRGAFVGAFCLIERDVVIGENTVLMDYVKLMPGTQIGKDCKLDDYVNTSGYVEIGDRVRIKRCTMIGQATRIEDDVWIGSHVTTTRLKYPKAMSQEESCEEEWVVIKHGAVIGSGALIMAGVTIGEYAMVGAGAVISKDCEPYGIYTGDRARLRRYRSNIPMKGTIL